MVASQSLQRDLRKVLPPLRNPILGSVKGCLLALKFCIKDYHDCLGRDSVGMSASSASMRTSVQVPRAHLKLSEGAGKMAPWLRSCTWLLLQRTWVRLSAHTWQLATLCNSSFRDLMLSSGFCRRQTCRQTLMHINKIDKSFKIEKLRWSPTRVWERGKDRELMGLAGPPDSPRLSKRPCPAGTQWRELKQAA